MAPIPDDSLTSKPSATITDPNDKVHRELFVGNTTDEMDDEGLKQFLNQTLAQVNLCWEGNKEPVLKCRVCGKFAFIELATKQDAALALNLDSVPYKDQMLKLSRPKNFPGRRTRHCTWNEILDRVMKGEVRRQARGAQ